MQQRRADVPLGLGGGFYESAARSVQFGARFAGLAGDSGVTNQAGWVLSDRHMSRASWLALCLVGLTVATACGSARLTGAASSSRSQNPTSPTPPLAATPASPELATPAPLSCVADQLTPRFAPAPPSNRSLAVVWLRGGGNRTVVRDVTDINHPFSVSTLPQVEHFVSASNLSYEDGEFVFRAPLSGAPATSVTRVCYGTPGVVWSRDGTWAAYMTLSADRARSELHVIAGGHDRILATGPVYPWGLGCEAQECADRLEMRTLISPDGAYISHVQNWASPWLRLWTASGKLLLSVDTRPGQPVGSTMSVWSGNRFYWRDDAGVHVWRSGVKSLVLAGVAWIRPKGSPAGGKIVYSVRDATGVPTVYLLDTASGTTQRIATMRSEPVFLTSRYLWYQGERSCTTKDTAVPCNASAPIGAGTTLSGVTYIYDLSTGRESQSVITNVWDVWPHAA